GNLGASGDDQIDLQPHQFSSNRERSAGVVHPSIVDGDISAFAESELLQFGQEGLVLRRHPRGTETRADKSKSDKLIGLLRARGEGARDCRAAEQSDELAPSHSITSSARASNGGGTVRPIAFAVLRLMTSSNVVGCSIGKLAGCAPVKILSTSEAA